MTIAPNGALILFNLSEHSTPGELGTEMHEDDLGKMKGVFGLYKAYKCVFIDRLGLPVLNGAVLRIEIRPSDELLPNSINEFRNDLIDTADGLRANANLREPLRHAIAIRKPGLVHFLRAVQCAASQHNLKSEICTPDDRWSPPVLAPGDFTEPGKDTDLRQTAAWEVVGLRRDDVHGHRLLVTRNDMVVVLPLGVQHWSWPAISDVLDAPTDLVGTIVRASKASPWVPDPGTRLEPRSEDPRQDLLI